LAPESFDIMASNCVINLSVDNPTVFRGTFRLRSPAASSTSPTSIATGACTASGPIQCSTGSASAGALYWNDFLPIAKAAGFLDPRLVSSRPIVITDETAKQKLGAAKFVSATYRLFKLDGLETACEDYGQAVIYKGTIAEQPYAFELDGHHLIERGKVFPVCGNTWRVLADTRLRPHFDFVGDFSTLRDSSLAVAIPFASTEAPKASSGGCC
jgi:hypothetical protein